MGGVILMNVPLFFMVSGFLAYKENMTLNLLLLKKIRYILLPYICAIVFSMLYTHTSFNEIMSAIDKHGFWFLQALFLIFIIYAVTYKSLNKLKYSLPIMLAIETGLLAASKFVPEIIDNYIGFSSLSRYFPCFILGIYIRKYKLEDKSLGVFYGSICLFFVILPYVCVNIPDNISYILSVVWYCAGSILIFYFIRKETLNIPRGIATMLTTFGRYTISIYIIHFYFIYHIPELCNVNATIMLIPTLLLAIIISYICILVTKILKSFTPLKYILPN